MKLCRRLAIFLGLAVGVGAGCAPGHGAPRPDEGARALRVSEASRERNVVLITIDGVRWQEVFRGEDPHLAELAKLPRHRSRSAADLMPNSQRLFFRGGTVLGDPRFGGGIQASGPHFVSLPGYLEILTGAATACTENDCKEQPLTLLDAASEYAAPKTQVAAFTSWERLGHVAGRPPLLHIDSGRPREDTTPAYPGHQRYRTDRETSALAIDYMLRYRPRLLWISLGDTDEWAHRGDYRGYLAALRSADDVIGEIAAHLDDLGQYGDNTTLMVTTDHGRDADFASHGGPASAKVWLFARGRGVPASGATATRTEHRLRDVAPTIRSWMGLPVVACASCGEPMEELVDPSVHVSAR